MPRIVLQGTRGTYMKYGLDVQETRMRDGERPEDDTWGSEPEDMWGTLRTTEGGTVKLETEKGDYRDYYKGIYKAIVQGIEPEVSAEDGYLPLLTS